MEGRWPRFLSIIHCVGEWSARCQGVIVPGVGEAPGAWDLQKGGLMNDCGVQSEAVVHVPRAFGLDTPLGTWRHVVIGIPVGLLRECLESRSEQCRRLFENEVQRV